MVSTCPYLFSWFCTDSLSYFSADVVVNSTRYLRGVYALVVVFCL